MIADVHKEMLVYWIFLGWVSEPGYQRIFLFLDLSGGSMDWDYFNRDCLRWWTHTHIFLV